MIVLPYLRSRANSMSVGAADYLLPISFSVGARELGALLLPHERGTTLPWVIQGNLAFGFGGSS